MSISGLRVSDVAVIWLGYGFIGFSNENQRGQYDLWVMSTLIRSLLDTFAWFLWNGNRLRVPVILTVALVTVCLD